MKGKQSILYFGSNDFQFLETEFLLVASLQHRYVLDYFVNKAKIISFIQLRQELHNLIWSLCAKKIFPVTTSSYVNWFLLQMSSQCAILMQLFLLISRF